MPGLLSWSARCTMRRIRRTRVSSFFASKTQRMQAAWKEFPHARKWAHALGSARRACLRSVGILGTRLRRVTASKLPVDSAEARALLERLLVVEPARHGLLREEEPGLRLRGVAGLEPPSPLGPAPEAQNPVPLGPRHEVPPQ